MKTLKPVSLKQTGKQDRVRKVLLGLVEHFIQTGKAVGSNSLKEAGFGDLSSATIRNYFSHLEQEGYLTQAHSSGGRVPTNLGYRTYAEHYLDHELIKLAQDPFHSLRAFDSREIALFLQEAAELLSQSTQCAIVLSAPRFDHDYVMEIKLVALDQLRCLCVLITDFGVIQTEILKLPEKLSSSSIQHIERYFHWRLTGSGKKPDGLEPREEQIGQTFYHELMLRYIIGYSNFVDEDIYRTGFSTLLGHPDFQEIKILAGGLSLFENAHNMRLLLRESMALNGLKCWIGDDLDHLVPHSNSSMIAIPYYIHHQAVGAVGLLGPTRLPYRELFGTLKLFSECVSEVLTRSIYKFKISFRQPEADNQYLQKEELRLIGKSRLILLEDKRAKDQ
ncbi:MAG: heat-inducible transcriptional repressor HrcA [Parachlamydiaceae bacterium]